jgi:hypothetical protein
MIGRVKHRVITARGVRQHGGRMRSGNRRAGDRTVVTAITEADRAPAVNRSTPSIAFGEPSVKQISPIK